MEKNDEIRWGILGCGDVCEVKSGPAFNKVKHSRLVAVMRRNAEKAQDFAARHGVPKFYTDAEALINDPEVNAVYIATPPAYHESYAIKAMEAGKPVYIEKPVALNSESCERILHTARKLNIKASVAHYRRALPTFKKLRSLIGSGVIGKPTLVIATTLNSPTEKMSGPDYWRTTPELSGGGLFFDLAPHQLDIFFWLFGQPRQIHGHSLNQKNGYSAPDLTNVEALFDNNIYLHGIWAFNVSKSAEQETCEIIGEKGKISFSFFRMAALEVFTDSGREQISLEYPTNIQQPMIDEVVQYFRGEAPNPCSLDDALVSMRMMDATSTSTPVA